VKIGEPTVHILTNRVHSAESVSIVFTITIYLLLCKVFAVSTLEPLVRREHKVLNRRIGYHVQC
jgi:hypothetical protein